VPGSPYPASAAELKRVIEAERGGGSFLLLRSPQEQLELVALGSDRPRLTIGRRPGNDVVLEDPEVSRVHAELALVSDDWTIEDDGLSHNGTYVNAVRLEGRRRLRDGDLLGLGQTVIAFRAPPTTSSGRTVTAQERARVVESLTPSKRRVVAALSRPFKDHTDGFAVPASNKEIAAELFLTVPAVRTHLRELFKLFELDDLPDNQKRIRLVELAFRWGLASDPGP
jgi:pSer/pThr/pTyr-binding forkhead associated (FHA) protein